MLAANVYTITNAAPVDISGGLSGHRYNVYVKIENSSVYIGDASVSSTSGLKLIQSDGITHFSVDHDAIYAITTSLTPVTLQVLTAEA
jgi:hypothetical protein